MYLKCSCFLGMHMVNYVLKWFKEVICNSTVEQWIIKNLTPNFKQECTRGEVEGFCWHFVVICGSEIVLIIERKIVVCY